ncbi:hypothetical protein ACFSR7_07215 [Cohnella sp. GCM10020058]|uniref:hypothetical protein n=1 Tax=Cohnella sp. GCM10020058 TaxID=3317330 RepID=UPI0036285485
MLGTLRRRSDDDSDWGNRRLQQGVKAHVAIPEALRLTADALNLQVDCKWIPTAYLNANTFIRTFKKLTGLSPGEYRKETLRDGGARGESVDVGG